MYKKVKILISTDSVVFILKKIFKKKVAILGEYGAQNRAYGMCGFSFVVFSKWKRQFCFFLVFTFFKSKQSIIIDFVANVCVCAVVGPPMGRVCRPYVASTVEFFDRYDEVITGRLLSFHLLKTLAGLEDLFSGGTHSIPYTLMPGRPA
jgi:hypothetical protein